MLPQGIKRPSTFCGYAHICLVPVLRKTKCPVQGHGSKVSLCEFLVAPDSAPAKGADGEQSDRAVWNLLNVGV